ncbi:MAG TPA: S1 RNA-binding domain-containing protein [Polyangiaceae bacterium]|nr:S1 RNA-binding domain-containing protein [Polyangiaceae bacterium]
MSTEPVETKPEETTRDAAAPAGNDVGSAPAAADAAAPPAPEGEGAPASEAQAAAASDAEADGDGDDGEEGGEGGDEASGDASAAPGEPGAAPKKKRRRRKKKKPAAPGAEGAEGQPAEGQAAEAGAEGEHKKKHRPDPREALPFRIGEEVFGKVEKVTEDAVWIDVAGKALGLFDRRELEGGEPPQPGDQFIATVASHGLRGGMLRMSRATLPIDEAKKKVEAAKESGELVEGFITGAVRGGVEVDIDGLRAFAPASHVELRPGADLGHLVGRRMPFVVLQYEKKGRDVVVSRKKFLHDEATQARAEALKTLTPGSVHQGIVRTIVQWGVFVALPDAGNLEGLIHATEASHERARLSDLFKPGDHIEVKVLKIDEKGKLWLSRKAMTNDPWDAVAQKYAQGTRHKGKVVRLQPFGAFIELEPGIDGLAYTADLSLKPVQHPKDVVKLDEEIEVVVANCDPSTHKISLHPAPPIEEADEPRPKVGPHRVVKVAVVSTSEAGLLVRVLGLTGRAARGFIPAGHTGTQRGTDLRKVFPIGTKLEAKVLEVDARRGETKLSIRAMKEDAEKAAYNEYREQVNREAKFGTFADLLKK